MRAERYDAVIVGAGFAGLSAGNVAAAKGRKVAVLEAQSRPWLNNSRVATGVLHFAFAHPKSDPVALAGRLTAVTEGAARPDLAEHAGRQAAAIMDWLSAQGADLLDTDYGKGPLPVLQPQRSFRQGLDWQSRGCALLLDRLIERFEVNGGVILDGTEARDLIRAADRVQGVIARRGDEDIRFEADSVVLADGGFQANRRLVQRFIAPAVDKIRLRATPSGHGRGIELAEMAGAKLALTDCFYGHLQSPQAFINDALWPYPNMDCLATSGIVVDRSGRRIADEDWGAIWLSNVIARRADPLDCYAVFDSAAWQGEAMRDFVPPNPLLPEFGGTIRSAPEVAILAIASSIDTELTRTVANYNAAVRKGRAAEMAVPRGAKRYPPVTIEQPPFYAVPLCAGITSTMGGVLVNAQGNALRHDGSGIAGLYVAGSSTGGYEGGPHAGYLGGLMKAFLTGYSTGQAIANTEQDPLR
ncbi:MAG: FAD-dependent oxidoreductase [Xanthobacteraceae bacterium]